jgi:chemotaxis protein MotB
MSRQSRAHVEEHENHDRWLVSYADFITLLFAFFVVLYATSTQNEEKEKRFENSIREKFKLIGNLGGTANRDADLFGPMIEPIDVFKRKTFTNIELEDYIDKLLKKRMAPEERKIAIGGLRHDSIGVRIDLAASTFFPIGETKLRFEALKSLDKIAEILKEGSNKVIIEGHTDDTPAVGRAYDSNWELASLRATSVVKYLIKYHGISPKRLAAISYADQRPLLPNTTEANKAKNRRIEILIVNNDNADL